MKICNVFSHSFEARYDEVPNELAMNARSGATDNQIRALLYRRVYVKDVCTRCGETVERNSSTESAIDKTLARIDAWIERETCAINALLRRVSP